MSWSAAERLAETLLYEGYVLYPYRGSSLKNRQRWPFGALYPPEFCAAGQGDSSYIQSECLIAGAAPSVRASLRFLQLALRPASPSSGAEPWHEAIERRIDSELLPVSALARDPLHIVRELAGNELDGQPVAAPSAEPALLRVELRIFATLLAPELWRVHTAIENRSACMTGIGRAAALPQTLSSTHLLLACTGGRFISLLEPPAALQVEAAACTNVGTWPVLVGEPGRGDVMLSSPIILYDRPRIAPESRGDFYDATEIDEMLTLRVMTLTEQERQEARRTDPRVRRILERTAALDEAAMLGVHGSERPETRKLGLEPGARVRIRPRPGGDVLDLALADQAATVATIEQDLEGRVYYTVTVDCDPGRDLGLQGQPGHRFFFRSDELEPLA